MKPMNVMKMLAMAVCLAMVGTPHETHAQRKDYKLWEAPYYLKHAVGQQTLTQCWVTDSGLTQAYVEANIYPKLFLRLNGLGFSDAQIMTMKVGPAAHDDAFLWGQGGGQPITGQPVSNNGIEWPAGVYSVNFPCFMDGGDIKGQGTGFAGTVGGAVSVNTNLVYDHSGWLGGIGTAPYAERNLLQTGTWGVLSGATSYTEGGTCRDFRLTGNNGSWWDSTYVSNGIGAWDLGEQWVIERIFAETFNGYGVMNVRGTPATYNVISCFQNALGAIGLIGSELNTINITTLSGDDNPALVVMRSGFGRGSGGNVSVSLAKSESGKRTPNKAQIILWQRDPSYGNLNFDCAQGDMNNLFLDAQFVMNNNTSAAGQILHAQFRAWNYRTTVHDVTNHVRWPAQAYRPYCLTYTYINGISTLFDCAAGAVLPSSPVNATDRLGWVANNGTFDYANGLPAYPLSGGSQPPPPTCVWVVGAWVAGPCINNEQIDTRSVTTSVVGCTPTDPMPATTDTLTCGSPPPPPVALYTKSPCNNASPSTSIDIPNVVFKRIVLTNVTFTDPTFNYQRLVMELGGTTGVRILPDGRFRAPNGQYASQTTSPVVRGVLYPTLEITFSSPITSDRLFGIPGTGSAIRMTCSKLELFSQ